MDRAEFSSGKSGMTGEEVIDLAADDSVSPASVTLNRSVVGGKRTVWPLLLCLLCCCCACVCATKPASLQATFDGLAFMLNEPTSKIHFW